MHSVWARLGLGEKLTDAEMSEFIAEEIPQTSTGSVHADVIIALMRSAMN